MQHTKFRLAVNRHNLKLFYLVGAVTFYGQYRLYMKYKEDGGFKPMTVEDIEGESVYKTGLIQIKEDFIGYKEAIVKKFNELTGA